MIQKNYKQFVSPILVILVIILIFLTSLITQESTKLSNVSELKQEMQLENVLSKFIHEIQRERGVSSGYVASSGAFFRLKLKTQRARTDRAILSLKPFLQKREDLKEISSEIKSLQNKRKEIDRLSMSVKKVIDFYSNIDDKCLKIIAKSAKLSKFSRLTQELLAYSNLLYAKENAGIERAIGTVILSNTRSLKNDRIEFIRLIAMQDLYLKKFYNYALPCSIKYYEKTVQGPEFAILSKIKKQIVEANSYADLDVDPVFWLRNMTLKIDKLKKVDDYLAQEITNALQDSYKSIYSKFTVLLSLAFIFIFIFIFISITLVKQLRKEKRTRLLMEKYVINSATDLKGNITYVSEAFCAISGYKEEELLGKQHSMVRHPDMPSSTFKEVWKTIKSGNVWTGRIQNRKKDGGSYWVYATIEPLYDKKGKIEGYAAIRIDITKNIKLELKVTEEVEKNLEKDRAMLQQSKLAQMGEMISMIAHQWRQPLSAISATSSSIGLKAQIGNLDKETTVELANRITEYSQHLSETIDDFRNFFKENKTKEKTTIHKMVQSTLDIVEISLESSNIKVVVNLISDEEVETYINEVKQVILNIIKNAEDVFVEKNSTNAKILIEIEKRNLRISDNAGGIPEDIIEKIFEPYFSTKTKKDGTGLGLYMSKTIIEDHCGGELKVSNNALGAVFEIKL